MSKIAFFVEGDMEKEFLENSCKGSMIARIPNGEGVSADAIARRIYANYLLYKKSCKQFVVLLDREGRAIDCATLVNEIKTALRGYGINVESDWYFGVADRTIENWIAADEILIRSEFLIEDYEYENEAKSGANKLQELFRKRKKEIYNKRVDGVRLLKKMCPTRVCLKSPSAKIFFDSLYKNFEKCWWLQKEGEAA